MKTTLARNLLDISPRRMDPLEAILKLDQDIVQLLDRRNDLCTEIGSRMQELGLKVDELEQIFIDQILKDRHDSVQLAYLEKIFRSVNFGCRTYLESAKDKIACAFAGPIASFSHQAASQCFGDKARYKRCKTDLEVFDLLVSGEVAYGIVAIENTITGPCTSIKKRLRNEPRFQVRQELILDGHLSLLGIGALNSIKIVYSSEAVWKQSRIEMLKRGIRRTPLDKDVAPIHDLLTNPECAVLASPVIAKIWGLNILEDHLEKSPDNATIFLVITFCPDVPQNTRIKRSSKRWSNLLASY